MKVKQLLDRMNFTSACPVVEVCDVNLSVDNRNRIWLNDVLMKKGGYLKFGDMTVNSFSILEGALVIFAR